jgi:hypothetical protein
MVGEAGSKKLALYQGTTELVQVGSTIGFLFCIRARLQSCHHAANMIGALAPATVTSAQNPNGKLRRL